jgi:tRNA nucleotidyltransferase (CCA-adding enzyme)
MHIYLVGGAVRDALLNLPVTERDWVVVGATPEEMQALGFKPVGKDFPVFLHPETHEEYALARTERKTAPGYHGFRFQATPEVTLQEDLARRDLTINAMARDAEGRLIDPYHGLRDLQERRLCHVSPAFAEDPVRILRLARFAARFARLGFQVAAETQALMHTMVTGGEVDSLVPERVWAETVRALAEPNPERFLEVLRNCAALGRVFPELERLFGVPQPAQHHPEIDTGVHLLLSLTQAVRLQADTQVRFAVLVHDLGKGTTPPSEWPRHLGHETRGAQLIYDFCQRLRIPKAFRHLGMLVAHYHTHCHRALELRSGTLLKTLYALDAFRKPQRFAQFLLACEADARGRRGLENRPYPQAERLQIAYRAAAAVTARPFVAQGLRGNQLKAAIRQAQAQAIAQALRSPARIS